VLYEAAGELSQEQGLESMLAAFPTDEQGNTPFNEAVAVFIPKKAGHVLNGVAFHRPAEARPLSIVNTDNRLMANAFRLRVEPLLAQAVSPMQRGLLAGTLDAAKCRRSGQRNAGGKLAIGSGGGGVF
jgi:hypothetical protein